MAHNKETHDKNVNDLCRVCGCFALSFKEKQCRLKPLRVDTVMKKLNFVCGYSLKVSESFSLFVCRKCYAHINNGFKRFSIAAKESLNKLLRESESIWAAFDEHVLEDDCTVCNKRKNLFGLQSNKPKGASTMVSTAISDNATSQNEGSIAIQDISSITVQDSVRMPFAETSNADVTDKLQCATPEIGSDSASFDVAASTSNLMSLTDINDEPITSAAMDSTFDVSPPVSPTVMRSRAALPDCQSTPVRPAIRPSTDYATDH